jgi:hypothetical protein
MINLQQNTVGLSTIYLPDSDLTVQEQSKIILLLFSSTMKGSETQHW